MSFNVSIKIDCSMGHGSHDGCPKAVFAGKAVYLNKDGDYIRMDATFKLRT